MILVCNNTFLYCAALRTACFYDRLLGNCSCRYSTSCIHAVVPSLWEGDTGTCENNGLYIAVIPGARSATRNPVYLISAVGVLDLTGFPLSREYHC